MSVGVSTPTPQSFSIIIKSNEGCLHTEKTAKLVIRERLFKEMFSWKKNYQKANKQTPIRTLKDMFHNMTS